MPARKQSTGVRKSPLRVAGSPASPVHLARGTRGHPHPYTSALVRYAPVQGRPSTLSGDFIRDLLEVTGADKVRDFRGARDYAVIRMLTEGVRRAELVQMRLADLPADLISTPYVRVVAFKGARAEDEGRIVPLTP